jgi:glutathione S-transferase
MLGETFSLADLIVSGVVGYSLFFGTPLDSHPHVKAWLERCQARPSYQLGMKS